MVAPNVTQMAQAYIASVRLEIDRHKLTADEHRKRLADLEVHLEECLEEIRNQTEIPTFSDSKDERPLSEHHVDPKDRTESIKLPNPFEMIKKK
jgi:hypothetical protein